MMGTETESISLRIQGYPSSQNGDITNIHTPCTATVCSKGVSSIRLLQVLGARRRPSPTRKTQSSGPPLFPLRQNAVYRIVCSGKVGRMLSSFFEAFKSFDVNKLKPFLKMAIQRIQIATNKKTAAVKITQRDIASLLAQQKDEKAAIKVESIIREDSTIEAYGILELVCELLHERARLIASEKECPDDLKSAVVTLIWSANRADIPELQEVKKQFTKKFGREFIERAEKDEDRLVNERVAHKLSIRPPSAAIVEKYLREIARSNNVEWTPLEQPSQLSLDQKAFASTPAPTGVSVAMGPASGFGHLYTAPGGPGRAEGGAEGGGEGGTSMPIAHAVSSSTHLGPDPGAGKADVPPAFQPPLPFPPLPTASAAPPTDEALHISPPSAPAELAEPGGEGQDGGEGGGEGGGEEAGGAVYDIPLPPSTHPGLPPATPTMGSEGTGGEEVEDLLTRFNRLQGRG